MQVYSNPNETLSKSLKLTLIQLYDVQPVEYTIAAFEGSTLVLNAIFQDPYTVSQTSVRLKYNPSVLG